MTQRSQPSTPFLVSVLAVLLTSACSHAESAATGESASRGEPPALQEGSIESGGRTRSYLYWRPETKDPRPLVISLHGRLGQGIHQSKMTGLTEVAAREGFIVVFPDGVRRSWADARGATPASEKGVDDVRFISDLIDTFVRDAGADPRRVYVLGMSNGALMSVTLGCRLSERVAAVVSVTGNMPEALKDACKPARAVPIAFFLGDEDKLMPFAGGSVADRGNVLSAAVTASTWAAIDGCAATASTEMLADTAPDDGTRVELSTWKECRDGAEVRLYAVHGGGHTWPGGGAYASERIRGRISQDLNASNEAWAFLSRFSLPAAPAPASR